MLIIYPQLTRAKTGGQVYDFALFRILRSLNLFSISELIDKDLRFLNRFLISFSYLSELISRKRYDYILTNTRLYPRLLFVFVFLKLFRRDKIIMIHHHYNFMTHKGIMRRLHKSFELCFLRLSDIVIIPSPYVLEQTKLLCPQLKVEYIEIAFNKKNQTIVCDKNENQLLFVGNVTCRKGIQYLVYLCEFLKKKKLDFEMFVAGDIVDVDYYDSLLKEIREKSLTNYISFVGRVSDMDLDLLYQKSSLFVFPSLHEGYGMVILEAMSYGLPVIAFNNSAIPFTVRNMVNGILVQNENIADFNSAVLLVLSDKKLQKSLAEGAYNTFLCARSETDFYHDVEKFVKQLIVSEK